MKQNTKFLWIYVAILFSFALILIVFAGLSRNTENEQTEGLKEDIATLSAKNTELSNLITDIQAELDFAMEEKNALANKNTLFESNEQMIAQAISEYDEEKYEECKTTLSKVDPTTLSQSQTYVYNMIMSEIEEKSANN